MEIERIEGKTIKLGDKVRVTDPCYDMDVWCTGTLTDVLPGNYKTSIVVDVDNQDVCELEVWHEKKDSDKVLFEETYDDIGVDAGMAGVIDYATYEKIWSEGKHEEFYKNVSRQILNGVENRKQVIATVENGAFSSSGYGDGSYRCFVAKNAEGKIVYIRIKFLPY